MRKILLAILLLTFSGVSILAQTNAEKLKYVRKKFYSTESSKSLKMRVYNHTPEESYKPIEYKFWFDTGNNLRKAECSMGEEGYGSIESYYFDNGKLYFIFIQQFEPNYDSNTSHDQLKEEKRIYFYNENAFKGLHRKETSENFKPINKIKQVDINITATEEREYLERSKVFLRFSKKAKR